VDGELAAALRSDPDYELRARRPAAVRGYQHLRSWSLRPRALQADAAYTGILYTSSRAFPRSRKNPGPLIRALDTWLKAGPPAAPLIEDWLPGPSTPG
jgi:hypothetical protein